jgi:thiamine pyrophosphate-dependent acetolactate synthase large subunit-like protein
VNGAQALIRTLIACGVDTCFSNPGTSEMHFVAALDHEPGMRGVLCLFEGVATGAADGYGRMAGRPAATLLHLGPGLANGLANLHNAHRAGTPLLNIVGTTLPTTSGTTLHWSPTSTPWPGRCPAGSAAPRAVPTWARTRPTRWPPPGGPQAGWPR